MIELGVVLVALGLTLLAGLSTGIGGLITFFTKHTNTKMLSLSLGFSAGVMVYLSFTEMLYESRQLMTSSLGEFSGLAMAVLGFFIGILIIAIIDRLVPSYENPHEVHKIEDVRKLKPKRCKHLMRIGYLMALAITIHNFPEGIATFTSALLSLKIGIPIAIAIAIHNIPEGISVSMPIYCATGSRRKALFYSSLSGFAEPIGALIGFVFLSQFFSVVLLGMLLAAAAGIMVFISFDVLLPSSREYGNHHLSIYGFVMGMAVMALSLLLFV